MDRRRSLFGIFVHRTVHYRAVRCRDGTQEAGSEGPDRHPPAGLDLPGTLPWPSCVGRVRARSSSSTRNSGRADVGATAVPLSSTAHPGRTTAMSGAQSTYASRLPSPPSASATPCSAAH
jgi:hypothetical protein